MYILHKVYGFLVSGWANFDDISMETTPALSATDPGPDIWRGDENNSGSPATSNDWAKFNSESNAATIKVPSDNSDTPLADFTSLEKSGNTNRYVSFTLF